MTVPIYLIFGFVGFIFLTVVVIVSFGKLYGKERKEVKRLTEELNAQKKISIELMHYAEQIAGINGDKDKVAEKINGAKNEEEVLSIIAGLVNANNDRVRK